VAPSGDDGVEVPPGAPILEAAAWVGASCAAELDLFDRLTRALAAGGPPDRTAARWTVRAHRAELAEAWHRRLPELREFPRSDFVAPDPGPVSGGTVDDPTEDRWLLDALDALEARYLAHLDVAVGPADAPVADTLVRALAVTAEDRLALS
jgi:hypothetical protein